MKRPFKILLLLFFLAAISIGGYYIKWEYFTSPVDKMIREVHVADKSISLPKEKWKETKIKHEGVTVQSRAFTFADKDQYTMKRYLFQEQGGIFTDTFTIPGESISIRYGDFSEGEWIITEDYQNLPYNTLFIETDQCYALVSVPGVYKDMGYYSLERQTQYEQPVTITKIDGNFEISYQFSKEPELIHEIWYFISSQKLFDWEEHTDVLLRNDLAFKSRWSMDGYYYQSPGNYIPGSDNMYYRNPACYTGSTYVELEGNGFDKLAYVMLATVLDNQNSDGYFETGPKSLWLYGDYGIGPYFYDTRFNADIGASFMLAYDRYNDKRFLKAAILYGDFFVNYAENHSYPVEDGILVQDYWQEDMTHPTHVSLNHQLAQINFLYRLYHIMNDDRYIITANAMLRAIMYTHNEWVYPNHNFRYALHDGRSTQEMIDYPFLTYNDIYTTNQLLKEFFETEYDILKIMQNEKLTWIKNNNITGYYGETE